jgi:hypothetical protein
MQLDEHFSKPMKEFVSLCLKKNPAEVKLLLLLLFLELKAGALPFQLEITHIKITQLRKTGNWVKSPLCANLLAKLDLGSLPNDLNHNTCPTT